MRNLIFIPILVFCTGVFAAGSPSVVFNQGAVANPQTVLGIQVAVNDQEVVANQDVQDNQNAYNQQGAGIQDDVDEMIDCSRSTISACDTVKDKKGNNRCITQFSSIAKPPKKCVCMTITGSGGAPLQSCIPKSTLGEFNSSR